MSDLPPFGDATDEAVSASIDGELEDFAAARGLTVAEVTARLSGWSRFEARRAQLGDARAAVATELPPLDPAARQRLVDRAKTTGRRETVRPHTRRRARPRPVWRPIAAVAAVVAVIVAAAFGIAQLGGDSSGSASSKAATRAAAPKVDKGAFVGEVGEVSDPIALRTLLTSRLAGLPTHADDTRRAVPNATAGAANQTPGAPAPGGRDAALRCVGIIDPPQPGLSADPVVLLATAVFHGREAVVVGVRRGVRSIVFVAERASCAVLTSQST